MAFKKGTIFSEEHKRKLSLSHKGKTLSEISRKKIGDFNRGKKVTDFTRHKMSAANNGRKKSQETKDKIRAKALGRVISSETKVKMSIVRRGERHPLWKGGITPLNAVIRGSFLYRQWRSDIYTRDNFACQECGDGKGGNLHAHHIKRFSDILVEYKIRSLEEALACEALWDMNNGETLCTICHNKKHLK